MTIERHENTNIRPSDFDSIEKTIEHASDINRSANDIGMYLSVAPLQSKEAVQLAERAKNWVNMVKARINAYTPGETLKIADAYDIVHRIAFRQPADRAFINGIVLRAFDAMIHGDKSVDEYVMFRAIRRAVRQREKAFFDKPLTWTCISEERWYEESLKGFDHRKLTDYDILSRIAILLETDLFVYEDRNQQQFKKRLFEKYRNHLDAYDTTDTRLAVAVTSFLLASAEFLPEAEFEQYMHKFNLVSSLPSSIVA